MHAMERERGRRQEFVKDLRAEARQLLDRLAWVGDRDQRRRLARRAFELVQQAEHFPSDD
jgi:hypothetical protein